MIRDLRVITVLVVMVFVVGLAAPQPAHAFSLGGIVDSVKSTVSSVTSTVSNAVSGAVSSVTGAVSGVVDTVKGLASSAYNTVKDTVKNVVGKFTGSLASAGGGITDMVGNLGGAASSILPSGGAGGGCGIPGIGGALDSLKNLGGAASSIIDKFKSTTSQIGEIMKNKDANLFDKVKESVGVFSDFVNGNLGGAKDLIDKFTDGSKKILDDVLKNPAKLLGDVMSPEAGKNPIVEELSKLGQGLAEKGKEFFGKLKDGGAQLAQTAQGIFQDIKSGKVGQAVESVTKQMAALNQASTDPIAFNKKYGEFFSAGGDNVSASASLAGFKIERGSNISGGAMNEGPKKNQESIILDGHLGARFDAKGKWEGDNYSITASTRNVAGLSGYAEGSAKWMKDGTLLQASGRAEAVAGLHSINQASAKVQLSENFGAGTDVYGSAMVGAGAKAKGKVYAGEMGVEVKGGAEARVGAWVEGEATNKVTYKGEPLFTTKVKGGAGLGLGAGAGGGVSFRLDKVGFEGDVTLGPFKLGGGVYVNPKAVGQLAWDKGKELGSAVADTGKKAIEGGKKLVEGAGKWFKSLW